MKSQSWLRYLDEQRRTCAKSLFSVTELANVAGTSRNALNVELTRLRKRGIIEKYAHGKYGLPGAVSLEALVQSIDSHAYVTGFYALHVHNLVTQVPTRITCFTDRRSTRTAERCTPVGRLLFVHVKGRLYHWPQRGMAPPEQALCDYVYLLLAKGIPPEGQVTFCNFGSLHREALSSLRECYPAAVGNWVQKFVFGNCPGLGDIDRAPVE
jgi:hypothetical protein